MNTMFILATLVSSSVCLVSAALPGPGPVIVLPPIKWCADYYGTKCPNSCAQKGLECCFCEECKSASGTYGLTQTCSCCPRGSICCYSFPPLNTGGAANCCPADAICRKEGCEVNRDGLPQMIPFSWGGGSVACSTCKNCPWMNFNISADNEITEFYYDGVPVPQASLPNYNNWRIKDTVSIPSCVSVIAVKVRNYESVAGFLASNDAGTILTNYQWRCTGVTPPSNWMTLAYRDDAAYWDQAVEVDTNPGYPHNQQLAISTAAKWIWFTNGSPTGWGTVGYCRLDIT